MKELETNKYYDNKIELTNNINNNNKPIVLSIPAENRERVKTSGFVDIFQGMF